MQAPQLREPFVQREHLEYPEKTMFQMVEAISREYPAEPAYEFYGTKTSYDSFIRRIERAARAFLAMGIRPGDAVTICMPNTPQALVCFYAVNRIGAVANMVHPLSAQNEISFYLNLSGSKVILTLDLFYEKVESALAGVKQDVKVLVARIQDEATVKRLRRRNGQIWLMPENDNYEPIDGTEAEIVGIVKAVVREY